MRQTPQMPAQHERQDNKRLPHMRGHMSHRRVSGMRAGRRDPLPVRQGDRDGQVRREREHCEVVRPPLPEEEVLLEASVHRGVLRRQGAYLYADLQ